jgi:hypothetical protein
MHYWESPGDPEKGWCCANGAKMFDRFRYTGAAMKDGKANFLMEWKSGKGCEICVAAERWLNAFNVDVVSITQDVSEDATRTKIFTYADLDPKIPPGGKPLYLPDGAFNPAHPYVLFLYTKTDHNGAFRFTPKLCSRLDCWGSRGYKVVMRRIESKEEAKGVLDKFADDSIHHVVLSGHGNPFTLQWGEGSDGSLDSRLGSWGSSGTEKFLLKLREKLKINGTVLLDACSTAGKIRFGIQNLYEYVASKLPGRRITASTVPLSDNMWESDETGKDPREFTEDAETGFDETCQAGDRVRFVAEWANDTSTDETAIRTRGRPNCKELKLKEITAFNSCLSRCRSSCSAVWTKDWSKDDRKNAPVKLVEDEAAGNEIINPCWFGKKMVCKIIQTHP